MKQAKITFDEFMDAYLGRKAKPTEKYESFSNFTYAYTQKMIALVITDIEEKNELANDNWYQEHKPDIRGLLKAAIITTVWATGATENPV